MDSIRVGRACRALRIRRGLRQSDVADLAGVSRQLISKLEAGRIEDSPLRILRLVVERLGASLEVHVGWHGEGLDRLLDAAHAGLVEQVVIRLQRAGWQTIIEASFAIRGERGSIDVLAFHEATATLLVVEVKSVVPDSQAMMHALDRKARLAVEIGRDRGWASRSVSCLLVVGESTTARHRVQLMQATYRSAFPVRGRAFGQWLQAPTGRVSALVFLPFATRRGTVNRVTGRQRVRRPRT